MRMWMVNPKLMCRKHLLGEHVELHMLVGSINKSRSIQGFLKKRLLEPQNIEWRHRELAEEMERRGYNHNSPLPEYHTEERGFVNILDSLQELERRCEKCREEMRKWST